MGPVQVIRDFYGTYSDGLVLFRAGGPDFRPRVLDGMKDVIIGGFRAAHPPSNMMATRTAASLETETPIICILSLQCVPEHRSVFLHL